MSVSKNNYFRQKSEYTTHYRDMKGVDFSGSGADISTSRYAYAENMYRDYDGDGGSVIESFPGFRKIALLHKNINGIYSRTSKSTETFILIHAGTSLYELPFSSYDTPRGLESLATLENTKSHAFTCKDALYICDGSSITVVNDDGVFTMGQNAKTTPYIPTTYVNGEEYEQRNLLSNFFKERTFIGSCDDFGYGNAGLTYSITSRDDMTAAVSGGSVTAEANIPSSVRIAGKKYAVTSIASSAFKKSPIGYLRIAEGVKKIGAMAFSRCLNLVSVILPDSLEYIDSTAFYGCTSLTHVQLGKGLLKIDTAAFDGCDSLTEIDYPLDQSSFLKIENHEALSAYTVNYDVETVEAFLEFPINTPTKSIMYAKLGGTHHPFTEIKTSGLVTSVLIYVENKHAAEGLEVEFTGVISEARAFPTAHGNDAVYSAGLTGTEAILGCTTSEIFDGRVFLSGNPKMPNTVFYSERDNTGENNPLYFGTLNYFNDGIGGFTVRSLLATSGALAVFKSGDDGSGSIFYHTPKETGIGVLPKIYPVSYVHSGIHAVGDSISFFDDPLFVSPIGVCALEKQEINLERSIVCRSHNVNSKLLSEDLGKIRMASWCGYLVVLAGERVYLADSRQRFVHQNGGVEYEWYYLTGIGSYSGDERVYRYSSVARYGYTLHEGGKASGVIMSTVTADGETVYYVTDGTEKYEVVPTEEFTGGVFSPAVELLAIKDRLFFGTANGDLCVFNNDLRGKAPERISSLDDFDENEYSGHMSRRIHSDFYSYAGHAPRYALKTAIDNCGIPHLTKSTVKNSLAIKCKSFTASTLFCEVGTDTSGYSEVTSFPGTEFSFSDLDFSTLSSNTDESFTVPIGERERGWIEKQITLYSDEFASPFGVYSMSYRFTVKGKIKKL